MTGRTRLNRARRHDPGSGQLWPLVGLGAVVVAVLVVWLPPFLTGSAPANPALFLIDLVRGRANYPPTAKALLAGFLLIIAAVIVVIIIAARKLTSRRTWVDERARSMAQPPHLKMMLHPGSVTDAARLGIPDSPGGPPVGELLPTGGLLRASMEWVQVWIMGARAGKTTCVCIPQIVDAPGAVIATSNKRDIVDMTRGPRSMQGTVWVFDPQQLIGEEPTWWWNPLTYVTSLDTAERLADLFLSSRSDENAKKDAYFDGASRTYLAQLLLAGALGQHQITQVHRWLTDLNDHEPVHLLAIHGWEAVSRDLNATMSLTDRQRDGVVGGAQSAVSWLTNPLYTRWITTTGPDDERPEFNPSEFVQSSQTLYAISREGQGTASAITAALTVATITAAETLGSRSPAGRLRIPMLVMLDEAANVVKWSELPDMYSHFGSRGILVTTILQSWNQGVAVWGRDGMEKLWSAANVRVVGSGLAQSDFLQSMSTLIGDHDVTRQDMSQQAKTGIFETGKSYSTRLQRERILDPSDLAAMPQGRAVMLSSGAPAALLRLVHWSDHPDAELIKASNDYYTQRLVEQGATS